MNVTGLKLRISFKNALYQASRRLKTLPKNATNRWRPMSAVNTLEHIIGVSVSAITPKIMTAAAKVKANSLNKAPVNPAMKIIGEYTAAKVMVMATTGMAISPAPLIAAS